MSNEIEGINLVNQINDFLITIDQPMKIGLLFNKYLETTNSRFISYKTFQRVIAELAEREFIFVKKIIGGSYGTTTLVSKKSFENESIKKALQEEKE